MSIYSMKVAAFGQTRSGKTILLASLYGLMQSARYIRTNKYGLFCNNRSKSEELIKICNDLNDGLRPPASASLKEYEFGLSVKGINTPAMNIIWADYPGEWWTADSVDLDFDPDRVNLTAALLDSDAGLLMFDGEKFKEHGEKYLISTLRSFRNMFDIEKRRLANGEELSVPKAWILCLTKCDLWPETYSASDFYDQLRDNADIIDEIEETRDILSTNTIASSFGDQYLLLSSIKVVGNRVDTSESQGLDLIPPLLFKASLERLRFDKNRASKNQPAKFFQKIEEVGHFLQIPLFEKRNNRIREEARIAASDASALRTAISYMQTTFESEKTDRLVFEVVK
jgi:hypothetical protein